MGEFLHKYNTDNVHSRAVIVGFVNLLNSKIYFENVLSDTKIDVVYVPFFYNMGGDERFLQDYFLEWSDCLHPRHADGNYDVIPRGIATMSSKTIDTGKLTHRFVRGNYVKEVNGELQTYSAYLNSLPITMNFDVVVEVDSNLDAFKVEQALVETFYKNQVFSVTYKGFRIPCQAGFPEDYGVEKTFEFTYESKDKIQVKFSVAVETYFPVLDPTTDRNNNNRMSNINMAETFPEKYTKPRLDFVSPIHAEKYFSSGTMPISWVNTGPILRVNLYYRLVGTQDWIAIAKNIVNSGSFDWKIPYFSTSGAELSYEPQRATVITVSGKEAYIRPIIDSLGTVEQIVIMNPGFSYGNIEDIAVGIYPLPVATPPTFVAPVIQATTVDGSLIGSNIISSGSGFTPSPTTRIELKIEDANAPEVTYQVLDTQLSFTGDVDNTAVAPADTYITNISPTVNLLLLQAPLIGQEVSGIGIPTGSVIVAANSALNRLVINNTTNTQIANTAMILSASTGKITIQ
jgi:hypothetical protein